MRLLIRTRLGIGCDIEHSDDLCHIATVTEADGKEHDEMILFEGLLIKLPFLSVYLGEVFELEDKK